MLISSVQEQCGICKQTRRDRVPVALHTEQWRITERYTYDETARHSNASLNDADTFWEMRH
jgi:hypothetical protein